MPLFPPQDFRSTDQTHRQGLAADQPNAADVLPGTLYFSTDTNVLERSNGTIWENYSAGGGIGPAGPTGAQGGAGPPGLDGGQGEPGDSFPIPGPQGVAGPTGSQGSQGALGLTGADGEQGEQGLPGIAGARGATGSQGPMGPPGLDFFDDGGNGGFGFVATNIPPHIAFTNVENVFTEDQKIEKLGPNFIIANTGGAANENLLAINASGGDYALLYLNDDGSYQSAPYTIQRTTLNHQISNGLEVLVGGVAATDGYYEYGRGYKQGDWNAEAFNAGNFAASAPMVLTVASIDVVVNRWMVIGHTLFWNLAFGGTLSGTAFNQIDLVYPNGFTGAIYQDSPVSYMLNGGPDLMGYAFNNSPGSANLTITRDGGANFSLGTIYIDFNGFWEIQ